MDINKVLKAIADESRMKILTLLLQHPYCVRALARELDLTEATISQHLKVLRQAGLVAGQQRGYFMHYAVDRSVILDLADHLTALADLGREKSLDRDIKEDYGEGADGNAGC